MDEAVADVDGAGFSGIISKNRSIETFWPWLIKRHCCIAFYFKFTENKAKN
jgi:hypothetical protein